MRRIIYIWISGIVVLFAVSVIAIGTYFQHEIDHILGGNTKIIDTSQFNPMYGQIAIINVNLFTPDYDSLMGNQTVLINEDKIEAVGKTIKVPDNYFTVDGTGKFLLPGLIDSHIHIKKSKNDLLLYLANGITHIGEMTGMKEHFQWRNEIQEGGLGPGIYIASPKMNSLEGIGATMKSWMEKRKQNFPTITKAREGVRAFKSKGYDAIKLSTNLKPEIYFAIVDEAKKQGIPAIGHIPMLVTLDDLYLSDQSQLAHVEEITKVLARSFSETKPVYYNNTDEYLNYVKSQADNIAVKLKEKDMVIATTLWFHETLIKQSSDLAGFLKTIELEYMNPGWVEGSAIANGWLPHNISSENPNIDPENVKLNTLFWNTQVEAQHIVIRALNRHGVTMIIGTDANGANGVIPGFSLHHELQSLNRIGLSNSEILSQATKNAGEWMNQKIGKIEEGYKADLVILDKNPIEDISNTKNINMVITNGKLLDRKELDKILNAVKVANNESRNVSIEMYIN